MDEETELELPKLYRREFLNNESGTAFIEVSFDVEGGYADYKEDRSINGDIKIADCSRHINLEFYCYNEETKVERLKKIDLIIKHLQEARDFMANNEVVHTPRKKKQIRLRTLGDD
jgi:hypothetical protein